MLCVLLVVIRLDPQFRTAPRRAILGSGQDVGPTAGAVAKAPLVRRLGKPCKKALFEIHEPVPVGDREAIAQTFCNSGLFNF